MGQRGCVLAIAALIAGACSRGADPGAPLLITTDDPSAAIVREAAKASEGRIVADLSVADTEIWSVPADQVARFRMRAAGREGAFEMMPLGEPTLVPEEDLAVNALTVVQRAAVAPLIAGLPQGAFRIAPSRSIGVGRFVLGLGLGGAPAGVVSMFSDAALGSRVPLKLLGDRRIVLLPAGVEERAPDDFTWRGTVEGGGRATLTVLPTGITGTIHLPDGTYSISPVGNDLQLIRAQGDERPDHPPVPTPAPAPGGRATGAGRGLGRSGRSGEFKSASVTMLETDPPLASTCATDQGERIDTLFVFTPRAAAVFTAAAAKHAIDLANDVFIASQLPGRLHGVGVEAITFTEKDLAADFGALAKSAYLKGRRDAAAADVVMAVVTEPVLPNTPPAPCGYSGRIAPSLEAAFAVIEAECVKTLTPAHEVGHLLGAAHEKGTHVGAPPFSYGHGYVDISKAWRTVMATKEQCPAGCPRVPLWSSPLLKHPDAQTGRVAGVANISEDLRVARDRVRILATARCAAQ